ncbi:hypothetical protein GLOIN_2v1876992 [Rhizophagus irregularis DAOM 181602=DAOM 197198]|nr:hypothetical protein GLOIN_2v1876992 [Rhizophagus irregularis DAOM 181602=DAOM 197198]
MIIEKYKSPYEITSDRKNANVKFCIFKYLIAVILTLPLFKGMKTKYFNRIRFLLLKKYQLIVNWLSSESSRNNKTTTYIWFLVRQSTWYFRFYVPYNICLHLKIEEYVESIKRSLKYKKSVNYRVIYKDYKEAELTPGTKKAELFAKHKIRGIKNNMNKWKFLNNEQYIKSSDLALLYSKVNSHSAYNELTENIFLNHTFDEDDFAMIRAYIK